MDTLGLSSPNREKNGRIYSYLIRRLHSETYKEKTQNDTTDFSMAAVANHVTVSLRQSQKVSERAFSTNLAFNIVVHKQLFIKSSIEIL